MSRAKDLAALIVNVNTTEAKTDELTGNTSAGSIAVTGEGGSTTINLQQGLAKVWANNELSGTASVLDSFNQSSITDNSAGQLTMSFTNAMNNSSYSRTGMGPSASGSTVYASVAQTGATISTTQLQVYFAYVNSGFNAWYDVPHSGVNIQGDLA